MSDHQFKGFEVFKGRTGDRRHLPPVVRLGKSGVITFNAAATALLNTRTIELLYGDGVIGFRPCELNPNAYRMRTYGNKGSAVHAVSFCRYIGHDRRASISLPATWQDGGLVVEWP